MTHTYVTQNGKVMRETIGTGATAKVLDFIYDNTGKPFALRYSTNGGSSYATYYYVLNLQGDVVKLVRIYAGTTIQEYEEMASYTYNAWGEIISSSGSMADINPLRYRGYYYDTETGFYYLQSRYYDPANCRFISADTPEISAISAISIRDTNLFTYCGNNPVNRADDGGMFWNFVAGAVAGALVGAFNAVVDAYNEGGLDKVLSWSTLGKACVSAATGAVGGLVAASGVGIGMAVAWGAGTAAVESIGHQLIDTGGIDAGQLLADTAEGAIGGLIGGKGAINGDKYMKRQVSRLFSHAISDNAKKAWDFGWKMTRKYSKKFIVPTIVGIVKSFAGAKTAEAIIE